jgi:hypothetical protein
MLTVYFWTVVSLALLFAVPDPMQARREIAKREAAAYLANRSV